MRFIPLAVSVALFAVLLEGCNNSRQAVLPALAVRPEGDGAPSSHEGRGDGTGSPTHPTTPEEVTSVEAQPDPAAPGRAPVAPRAWGLAGLRVFGLGDQVAPNGLEFKPLFSLDVGMNLWL